MPIPTYTPGYPPDGSSLGQTKAVIRNNLDGTFQTVGIDHVNNNGVPGANPAGYHTVIHEVTQTTVNTVAGVNQIFSGVPGTLSVNSTTTPTIPPGGDTQLYALSASGILSQLTGKLAASNGYAWIGGILLQWGVTGTSSANIGVNFVSAGNVAFPNNNFVVMATPLRSSGTFTSDFSVTNKTLAGFTIVNGTGGATGLAYYWIAIGN